MGGVVKGWCCKGVVSIQMWGWENLHGCLILILFVCNGSILKCSGKTCKINGFKAKQGAYYNITIPFLERALM